MRLQRLAALQCRPGQVLLAVVWLIVLLETCWFLYHTGVQSTSGNVRGLPKRSDGLEGDTAEAQWKSIWESHGSKLYKMTRLKTLLDSKRKLLKFQPDKEFQYTAGVDMLLAQSLTELQSVTGLSELQERIKRDVTEEVEAEIMRLQFPGDCQSARKLICDLDKGCGFGCQIHHVAHCLTNAVALNRTMVLKVTPWRYAPTGHWNDVFLPTSSCPFTLGENRDAWGPSISDGAMHDESPSVSVNLIDYGQTVYDPPAMPFDVQQAVRLFHARPEIWWIGMLVKFLMRPSEASVQRQAAMDFGTGSPEVGVHIRRSDKVTVKEALQYEVDDYMQHVEAFCDAKLPSGWQEQNKNDSASGVECVAYLATDEPEILQQVREGYPHIRSVGNGDVAKVAADLAERNSFDSLLGIYDDVMHLSRADLIVGTFSSQVSRLAYEVMQHKSTVVDASFHYHSLDSVWYFGGQGHCRYCLTTDYTQKVGYELRKGDELLCDVIVPNVNGTLVCNSKRLGKEVRVPAGLIDWCSIPLEHFQFRNILPAYMSKGFHEH